MENERSRARQELWDVHPFTLAIDRANFRSSEPTGHPLVVQPAGQRHHRHCKPQPRGVEHDPHLQRSRDDDEGLLSGQDLAVRGRDIPVPSSPRDAVATRVSQLRRSPLQRELRSSLHTRGSECWWKKPTITISVESTRKKSAWGNLESRTLRYGSETMWNHVECFRKRRKLLHRTLEFRKNAFGQLRTLLGIPFDRLIDLGEARIDESRVHFAYLVRRASMASSASTDPISPFL